jgi:hypothetical protein
MPDQQPNQPGSLPDPNICRTQDIASARLMKCLVQHPERCQFLTQFAGSSYCRHPDGKKFLKPAEAEP